MTNIYNVRESILTKGSVIVTLYESSTERTILIGKTSIKTFLPEMENANGINIFLDKDYNISQIQITLYDPQNGIRLLVFNSENELIKTY